MTLRVYTLTAAYIDQLVVDAAKRHLRGICGDSMDELKGENYEVSIVKNILVKKHSRVFSSFALSSTYPLVSVLGVD